MKIRIMIYGDSNTHGYDAETGGRFDENTRWTKVCQRVLGERYEIIEEGLNGRNTCHSIPDAPFLNGLEYIMPCTLSHLPLDYLCVKLGSNDFDNELNQTPEKIAENAAKVLSIAKFLSEEKYPERKCKYVLMAPLQITEDALRGPFAESYDEMTPLMSEKAVEEYKKVAEKNGFLFFNANEYARCGAVDGVHLDAMNHRRLGDAFARWIIGCEEGR